MMRMMLLGWNNSSVSLCRKLGIRRTKTPEAGNYNLAAFRDISPKNHF